VDHSCLQRWVLLGRSWCRCRGALWFRKQHEETLRGAILREIADIEVVGIDLWAGMPEDEHGLHGRDEIGKVGEGECENILKRENQRMYAGCWTMDERWPHMVEMMKMVL
jgi:hypothetical protein